MRRKVREAHGDRFYTVVNYAALSFLLVLVAYPLIYILSASFSNPADVLAGKIWLFPIKPNTDGYDAVFKHQGIMTGYANTIFYTVVGTAVNVFLTIIAGYPLSRKDFYGRNIIMFLFTFTMFFTGGMIPTYMVVRSLGLINTRLSMILPGAVGVWNVIITRTYYQHNIPIELLEASQLDGCNDFRFVRSVVVPLSAPITAVIALFYAVGHWNEYFNALIYLNDAKYYPLQLVLREILIQNNINFGALVDPNVEAKMASLRELLKYSLIVVASGPILAVYPFVQRYFVKGIMIGAIKG